MGDFDEYRISIQALREGDVPGPHALRTCLFFEQRSWRHVGQFPNTVAMQYIRALLTTIRKAIRASRPRTKNPGSRKRRTRALDSSGSATTPTRHPPITRRPGPSARKVVNVYFHDTEESGTHRWTLDQLLVMIERHRPHQTEGPDRTFMVGGKREYLAISTSGPDHFKGQHPLWGEKDKVEGAMMFDDVSSHDVRQILETFYAGRKAEGCFAPYYGHFQVYVPPKLRTH